MTSSSSPRRVAIVGGNRIPFARSNKQYARASNQDMLTAAIDGLAHRYGLAGDRVGEVVAGAVLKHSRDFNLTREAVLGSALSPTTPAYDVQMACATGLQGDDRGGEQDRRRADRAWHRRRHRHHVGRADRGERGAAAGAARRQPSADHPGTGPRFAGPAAG